MVISHTNHLLFGFSLFTTQSLRLATIVASGLSLGIAD